MTCFLSFECPDAPRANEEDVKKYASWLEESLEKELEAKQMNLVKLEDRWLLKLPVRSSKTAFASCYLRTTLESYEKGEKSFFEIVFLDGNGRVCEAVGSDFDLVVTRGQGNDTKGVDIISTEWMSAGVHRVWFDAKHPARYVVELKIVTDQFQIKPLVIHLPIPICENGPNLVGQTEENGHNGGQISPWGVVYQPHDRILVAQKLNHDVVIYSPDGNQLGALKRDHPSRLQSIGGLNRPTGLAIDSTGRIILTDKDNHRVVVFDSSSNVVETFGGKGDGDLCFNYPHGVASNYKDDIIVADSRNDRVVVYSKEFEFIRKVLCPNPRDVAGGKLRYVVVSLFDRRQFWFYNRDLSELKFCLDPPEMNIPRDDFRIQGIDMDSSGNILFVRSRPSANPGVVACRLVDELDTKMEEDTEKGKDKKMGKDEETDKNKRKGKFVKKLELIFDKSSAGHAHEPQGTCLIPSGQICLVDKKSENFFILS